MDEKIYLLMFDASMKTVSEKKKYNKFLKQLKSKGYIMLQKSVYYSFSRSSSLFVAEIKNIRKIIYSEIKVRMLCLPIKYIENMENFNCEKIKCSQEYIEYV